MRNNKVLRMIIETADVKDTNKQHTQNWYTFHGAFREWVREKAKNGTKWKRKQERRVILVISVLFATQIVCFADDVACCWCTTKKTQQKSEIQKALVFCSSSVFTIECTSCSIIYSMKFIRFFVDFLSLFLCVSSSIMKFVCAKQAAALLVSQIANCVICSW